MNRIPIAIAKCEDDSWTMLHARLLYAASTLHTLEGKLGTKVTDVVREITLPYQFEFENQIREFFGGYLSHHLFLCVDVKAEFNFVRITLPDFVEPEITSSLSDVPDQLPLDKMSGVSLVSPVESITSAISKANILKNLEPVILHTDAVVGRLDRCLSEILLLAESRMLDTVDAQTLKHHADDLIGVGQRVLSILAKRKGV